MDVSVHSILNSSYWQDRIYQWARWPSSTIARGSKENYEGPKQNFEGTVKYCGFQSLVELTAADNAQDLVLQHYIT